jgi:hypothetical protein
LGLKATQVQLVLKVLKETQAQLGLKGLKEIRVLLVRTAYTEHRVTLETPVQKEILELPAIKAQSVLKEHMEFKVCLAILEILEPKVKWVLTETQVHKETLETRVRKEPPVRKETRAKQEQPVRKETQVLKETRVQKEPPVQLGHKG